MEIKYLMKLKKTPKIQGEKIEGVLEIEIKKVEDKFKIKFPQAYKEFLFLAGAYSGNICIQDTNDLESISDDEHQEMMNEEIERSGIKFERPFWLFAQANDCEQFWFFYLDEDSENPSVYAFEYGSNPGDRKIISLNKTFSELIDRQIDMAIEDAKYS